MNTCIIIAATASFIFAGLVWWYLPKKSYKTQESSIEDYPEQTVVRLADATVFPNGSIVFNYTDGSEEVLKPNKEVNLDAALWNSSMVSLVISNLLAQHDKEIKELQKTVVELSARIDTNTRFK